MVTKKTTAKKPPAAAPAKPDTNGYKIKAEEWGFTKGDTDSQVMAALSTRSALTATTYKAFAVNSRHTLTTSPPPGSRYFPDSRNAGAKRREKTLVNGLDVR